MKKFPFPDKVLKTNDQIQAHFSELAFNAMLYLKLDGYNFWIMLPGNENFVEHKDSGASITLEYPYKKFSISIQQDTIKKCLTEKINSPFWRHVEESIFHELIHIILWNYVVLARKRFTDPDAIDDFDEFTTDHLTHCIYPLVEQLRKK